MSFKAMWGFYYIKLVLLVGYFFSVGIFKGLKTPFVFGNTVIYERTKATGTNKIASIIFNRF